MKKQALREIISQGEKQILSQIRAFKLELQKIKLEAARGEQKNRRLARSLRRNVAQLLTALTLNKIVKEKV